MGAALIYGLEGWLAVSVLLTGGLLVGWKRYKRQQQ
jgi:predicted negative regulator of RcsB-dependent stress response